VSDLITLDVRVPQIRYTPGQETTVEAFMRFQEWLPTADRRFGLDGILFGNGVEGAALRLMVITSKGLPVNYRCTTVHHMRPSYQ
jgi:hypothetical protein